MNIFDLHKILVKHHISPSLEYDDAKQCYWINLNTQAKSHLYLYEDGTLYGRYDYTRIIDLNQDEETIIQELCYEYAKCIRHRSYGSYYWEVLCVRNDIDVEYGPF